jgi:transposase
MHSNIIEEAMNINCFKNHGKPYLQVIGFRSVLKDGERVFERFVVRNLGPLSRFDDGLPDFVKRLRESFRAGTPIIKELNDLVEPIDSLKITSKPSIVDEKITFDVSKMDPSSILGEVKNIGYFVLDAIYNCLGINEVMILTKSREDILYDLNGITKMLMFGRILQPDSKIGTFDDRKRYAFQVTSCEDVNEVYHALDVLDNKAGAIQNRMHLRLTSLIGRSTQICFYDVTNFWFEINNNDKDLLDDDGNVIQYGLRKRGVSKENRREPIVQMGLFIDDNGIPIGYQLFPGNNNDQSTLRPALEKTINKMNLGRVIVVADAGLNGGPNIASLLEQGNGYIMPRSAKSSNASIKRYMIDDSDYQWNEDKTFKVKSKIINRLIIDSNGNKMKIDEKLVVYWSQKHYDRDVHEMMKLRELLDSIVSNPNKVKTNFKLAQKFLVEFYCDPATGEVEDGVKHFEILTQKLDEQTELMGYYSIFTSEKEMSDLEIINKYHGLSRIEDSFRITKSDLEGRPVFVRTPEHINAHFLICFVALTMIRMIQFKILKYQGKDTLNTDGWESGLSADRIKKALNSWITEPFCGYWRLSDPEKNEDLQLILETFGVDWKLGYAKVSELRNLKRAFDKNLI